MYYKTSFSNHSIENMAVHVHVQLEYNYTRLCTANDSSMYNHVHAPAVSVNEESNIAALTRR